MRASLTIKTDYPTIKQKGRTNGAALCHERSARMSYRSSRASMAFCRSSLLTSLSDTLAPATM